MNVDTLTVDNKPVLVIDDFFNKDICVNWLRYYLNCQFSISAGESRSTAEGQDFFYFIHGMEKLELENVFEMSNTILPVVNKWNEDNGTNLKYTDCVRNHINLIQQCDTFHGHYDYEDDAGDSLIFLWFGNPYFKDIGGGFYLGKDEEIVIAHKFNRCVIFPGNLFHKVQRVVDENEIRLTVYIGFRTQETKEKELQYTPSTLRNALNKDTFIMRDLVKDLHKDFGIGI